MSKLYFGVCPYGTIADVFINTLAGWSEDWVQPCTPEITATGHLIHCNHEQYVLDLTDNKPMTFRDIDWTDRLGDIEALLNGVGDRKVWIGNFKSKQARIIKKHFGDDVTTVGIHYGSASRNIILENVVSYYDVSNITDRKDQLIAYKTKYYSEKEKWDKLVPVTFSPETDVSIDIETFFRPDNYITEIEIIDGTRNKKQLEYYFTWLVRTKERLNESF